MYLFRDLKKKLLWNSIIEYYYGIPDLICHSAYKNIFLAYIYFINQYFDTDILRLSADWFFIFLFHYNIKLFKINL